MDLEVNMSQRAVTENELKTYIFNGDILYKYLKDELFFEIKDNVLENVPGWLYNWTDTIMFMSVSNNYATTNEDYAGIKSLKSSSR